MGVILPLRELRTDLERLKAQSRRIVFTNGCFDLIHVGHIRYLRAARELGHALVVGLNSDSSVSAIKPGRPITPEAQRAEVLAALSMVDYVTIFTEATPYEIIAVLKPDVLVKGGDWKKDEIVGSDLVSEVRSLPYVEGISTTAIIERIRTAAR